MFKILDEACKPTKGSKYAAGIDLYAREDIVIGAGDTVKVPLGVCIDCIELAKQSNRYKEAVKYWNRKYPNDSEEVSKDEFFRLAIEDFISSHYIALKPRSSLRAKGLISHSGVVDLDYRDELMMIVHNPVQEYELQTPLEPWERGIELVSDSETYLVEKGDKIAQAILMEHKSYLFGIESEDERVGGFGSTGE